ncbi:CPXCG motif-containing cysteine-rich protein [Limibacter armeniacum]|uniref:CPXCG motif-containing cysteine-rich protein n=1 Tax=Limibacter armeniacum TaxID=466084 RepID=UPI002FE64159
MDFEEEYFFQCPYCGEEISMIIDLTVSKQTYIEDCEVCCNPIEVSYETENGSIMLFDARSIEQ